MENFTSTIQVKKEGRPRQCRIGAEKGGFIAQNEFKTGVFPKKVTLNVH
jgi:hypothetical protein